MVKVIFSVSIPHDVVLCGLRVGERQRQAERRTEAEIGTETDRQTNRGEDKHTKRERER